MVYIFEEQNKTSRNVQLIFHVSLICVYNSIQHVLWLS